jgi:translation initiation factor 1 (eIF-1/SUI1)
MGKKAKPEPPKPAQEANATPLKHNPFAALASTTAAAHKPDATKTEPVAEPVKALKSRGRLVLRRETKHRAGKAVIVISGFSELRDFDARATDALAKELKQQLGCGGAVEVTDGKREVILQGDKAANVAALLRARGFRVDGVTS